MYILVTPTTNLYFQFGKINKKKYRIFEFILTEINHYKKKPLKSRFS